MNGDTSTSSILLWVTPVRLTLVALVIFAGWAMFQLDVPLFWDEIGVYGRGILTMMDGKVSLHPDALPPDISRGHPLLFTFLVSGWTRIFGESLVAMRSASLLVSLLLLVTVFWYVRDKSDKLNLLAVLLILCQPVFLAQSTLVLPEMMLALFTMLAFGAFLRRQYWVFFLAGSAMILTKETGIVLVAAFGLYDVVFSWVKEKRFFHLRFVFWALPVVPYAIFLLVQKDTHGWYFFPYHTDGFNLAGPAIERNLKDFLSFIFLKQGRYLWLILAVGALTARFLTRPTVGTPHKASRTNSLALTLSAVYLAFYSTTYYMNRYILVVVILLAIVLGKWMMDTARSRYQEKAWMLMAPIMLLTIVLQLTFLTSRTFKYDEDMSYKTYVEAQQEAIDYFVEQRMYETGFHVGFPLDFALMDARYGYLPDSIPTPLLNYEVREGTEHVLIVVPPGNINNPTDLPLTLVKSWEHGFAEIRHYRVGE